MERGEGEGEERSKEKENVIATGRWLRKGNNERKKEVKKGGRKLEEGCREGVWEGKKRRNDARGDNPLRKRRKTEEREEMR